MADTTEIEKKSLEAHVELCAQRYKFLEDKLESVEEKCVTLVSSISSLKSSVESMATKNNDRLIQWGIGIIGFLVATCVYLINHYVFK
jgi:phage shock protein A